MKKHIQIHIILFLISVVSLFPGCTFLYEKNETLPCLSTIWPHEKSDLEPDPALTYGKMENGFRYVLMENQKPPDRVSMRLVVGAGSLYETEEQQGLAHYLEHMMFNGTKHFPPGKLVEYFQSIGMDFGADANAHTTFAETVYDVVLPKGGETQLEEALLVLRDYADGATLSESEVEREKGIILSELRTRDSVHYRTYKAALRFAYPDTLLVKRFPIGQKEVIRKTNSQMLRDFYETWYRPDNMVLVVVGDTDMKMVEKNIKKRFSDFLPGNIPDFCPDAGDFSHHGIKPFVHYEKESGETDVSVEVTWTEEEENDTLDFKKKVIAETLAINILQNRLDAMLEDPDVPFTNAYAYSGRFLDGMRYAGLSANTPPDSWEEVVGILEKTLRKALLHGFLDSEVERVVKDYMASLTGRVKRMKTRESTWLSRSIANHFSNNLVFMSPKQKIALFEPYVRSLTPEILHNSLVSLFDRDHRLVSVTGNAKIHSKQKILKTYLASSALPVKAPEKMRVRNFPYLTPPQTPGMIREKKEIPDTGIQIAEFENGFRLNMKKTDFKKNEVVAVLEFGLGSLSEPKPGLFVLAEQVVNGSGLGALSLDEMRRALAGTNTGAGFHISEQAFRITGSTIPEEIPLMFDLMYAQLMDPGFREAAYKRAMKDYEQSYEEMVHTIDGTMKLKGYRFLADGHPDFSLPSLEEFQKLSLGDVKSWMDNELKKGRLELSVVGDFDPEKMLALSARYFGGLEKREAVEIPKEKVGFPENESRVFTVDTKIDKSLVVVAWPTTDYKDIHQVRRLSLLGSVFSERMRTEIREKKSLSYSQYAYNDSSRTYDGYGLFQAYAMIDPADHKKVVEKIKTIAKNLSENPVSEEELMRARKPVLTGIKDMLQTNEYWLNTVLSGSMRYPEQLTWCTTIRKDYASISEDAVYEEAKRFFGTDRAATIRIFPRSFSESMEEKPAASLDALRPGRTGS